MLISRETVDITFKFNYYNIQEICGSKTIWQGGTTPAGQRIFPDADIRHTSTGVFEIVGDDEPIDEPGTIPNTAILYHDGEELGRDTEIVELLVQPRINKGVNVPFGQTVEIGQYVTYTLTVTNPNEVNLYDYLVVDNLAGGALIGVRNIVVSPNVGYTTQETEGELRILLSYLPAEGSVTITFQARVAVGTPAGPVINVVHLYDYDTEPTPLQ
ncbi:MAG: isopeptide-forming domain-containing fimbrial protein [Oscillospiraceae bacterium]|nr:isopeptide-forming domain-containing fimbrial protein [Oscillospiraceae bacterium]